MLPNYLTPAQERRFFSKVRLSPETSCWIWTAACVQGYGVFAWSHRKAEKAHRVSYAFFRGPIPNGLHMDHLCRNTLCVNPDHLEPVTQAENNRRKAEAQTHCKRGHPLAGANLYRITERSPQRQCKICKAITKYSKRHGVSMEQAQRLIEEADRYVDVLDGEIVE